MSKGGTHSEKFASSLLFRELTSLHIKAGKPSSRAIAKAVGDISHTTVAETLSGKRAPSWPILTKLIENLHGDLEYFQNLWADLQYQQQRTIPESANLSARNVFVIHGRDNSARLALFDFLRSLDLRPIEWEEVVRELPEPAPMIHAVLSEAIARAQVVVGLVTPNDMMQITPEPDPATNLGTPQRGASRPNVLFELGMAFAMKPINTIIVNLGNNSRFSDVDDSLNIVNLDGSKSSLEIFSAKLKMAGCAVNEQGKDWLETDRFARLIT